MLEFPDLSHMELRNVGETSWTVVALIVIGMIVALLAVQLFATPLSRLMSRTYVVWAGLLVLPAAVADWAAASAGSQPPSLTDGWFYPGVGLLIFAFSTIVVMRVVFDDDMFATVLSPVFVFVGAALLWMSVFVYLPT